MPQTLIDSANIKTFGFSTMLDLANRKMVFDIAELTEFKGNGGANIVGINFSLNDSSGNPLIPGNYGDGRYDWTHPNITEPITNANPGYSGESSVEVDLVEVFGNNYMAIFQNFKIQGAIKDEDGKVYETTAMVKGAPMPPGFTDLGYVPGKFLIEADCANGYLSVREITNTAYCGKMPIRQSSNGTLYYPRGTVDPIPFQFTSTVAFTNNVVYTGNYKVINTTTAVYDSGIDFFVQVEYYTESEAFDITCEKHMLSIMCCLTDFQENMLRNCSGAKYEAMHDKWTEAGTLLAIGLAKESAGKDASAEALKIRKLLNCNCTSSSINRISPNPVNPMVHSIVVQGKNGTNATQSVVGNTKIFELSSNVYQVVKSDPNDLAFTITTNTSTPGIVKYILAFDYEKLAQKVNQYIATSGLTIGRQIYLCSIDYNGNKVMTPYPATTSVTDFLQALASVGCNTTDILDAILGLTAENGLYSGRDASGNPVIRLGKKPLIEDTVLTLDQYNLSIIGSKTSLTFNKEYFGLVTQTGPASSDEATIFLQQAGQTGITVTTNGERFSKSYLARSLTHNIGETAQIGSFLPVTGDPVGNPAPPRDPNKTAALTTGRGSLELYGKTQVVRGGGTFEFLDNTIPILPKVTTAVRLALTAVKGMIVIDTDLNLPMLYNGAKWVIIQVVDNWVQSTVLATTLTNVAGTINSTTANYLVAANSVTFDFAVNYSQSASGMPIIKITLPVSGIAGRRFHALTSMDNAVGGSYIMDVAVNVTGSDPGILTISPNTTANLAAGLWHFSGQIIYQTA